VDKVDTDGSQIQIGSDTGADHDFVICGSMDTDILNNMTPLEATSSIKPNIAGLCK
jgi:hypothetical protein